MYFSKLQIFLTTAIMIIVMGGGYYWFSRETPESAGEELMAQNIEISDPSFFAEIAAEHEHNIHDFLLMGASPGVQNTQGVSALMVAVNTGKPNIVMTLMAPLQNNPSEFARILNLQDNTQETALSLAVEKNNLDIVNLLLGWGANTALTNKLGQTPLILAVQNKFPALLPVLINADTAEHQGASVNTPDGRGETPLTYAIRANNVEIFDILIAAKAQMISTDPSGVTPLMVAAETGNDAVGVKLINQGAVMDVADRQGNTPLTVAISHSHPTFARMLLDKGADPDFHTTGPLPLQVAVATEPFDPALFNALLTHSKQTTALNSTLLFEAIDHKNGALTKALLDYGISVNSVNAKNETLLYHAIENGLEDAALMLIDKGTDTHRTGVPGMTPLERAVKHNEIKVVQKLLALGVSPDQKTTEGYTVAAMAVYSGYPEILDALLAKGAPLEKNFAILWSIRDGGGKAVPVLLKYGAKPNVMSDNGDPALWLAASVGELDAVHALIDAHAGLNDPNAGQGMPPLSIASHTGQLAVVKLLVESGAKLEVPDAFGMTPLAHAAYMTQPDIVEYLIGKGANVQASDKQGRSIVDLAALGETSAARDRVIGMLQQK